MRQVRIYQPGIFQAGERALLDKAASNHLLRVLRFKNKQTFSIFNGKGIEYLCTLEIDGKKAIAQIQDVKQAINESGLTIHLYQGISKGERMDIAIQKSVELGVHSITPLICERTVVNLKNDRLDKKLSHWQGVAISACEQSGRSYLPEIHHPEKLTDLANSFPDTDSETLKLVLDPNASNSFKRLQPTAKAVSILIGPEGGFTQQEILRAKESNFTGINLGPRILRTETAALAAITSAQLLWGDLG